MQFKAITILALLLMVAFTACSRRFDPETPCNFVQNGDLKRVSWNTMTPVKLYIHKSMPLTTYPEMENVIRESVKAWNDVAGREIIRIEAFQAGGTDMPRKDGYSMMYWMSSWEAGQVSEQARTTIYWSGSQIYEADLRINGRDHRYYVGNDTAFSGVDFKSLIIHELGHALGLAHAISDSVMNASLSSGYDRRQITDEDQKSIRCEY